MAEVGLVTNTAVMTVVGLVTNVAVMTEVGLVTNVAVMTEVGLVKLQTLKLRNYSINIHSSDYHPHAPHSSLVPTPSSAFLCLQNRKVNNVQLVNQSANLV